MHFQTNWNLLFNAYIKNTTQLFIFKGSKQEQINVGAKYKKIVIYHYLIEPKYINQRCIKLTFVLIQ